MLSRYRGALLPALVGALAFALFFRVELASGLDRVKGVGADVRLIHFNQEWVSLCLAGDPICREFWSPPVFFPATGALAFTDPALGQGLVYALARVAGVSRAGALVLTQMALLALAYAAAWWMLRRAFGRSTLASSLGALLFAFGAPVAAHADHPQLFATFPIPLVLGACARLLAEPDPRPRRRWWALLAGAMVVQAYLNLNLAWLLSFFLFWTALLALALPSTRAVPRARLRTDWRPALVGAALAAAALLPLALRMLQARAEVGGARAVHQWFPFLPQPESWLNPSPASWLWGRIAHWSLIRNLPFPWEHELGIGVATTMLCAAGAWQGWRSAGGRMLVLGALAAGLLTLRWPGGSSFWFWLHPIWPGAESIRAVGRIALVLLAPAAAALATALDGLIAARRLALAALAGALVLLEQQRRFDTHSPAESEHRAEQLAAAIPADCPSFFWSPARNSSPGAPLQTQVDAMWAALFAATPTANGYSGYAPEGWGLADPRVTDAKRWRELGDQLAYWALHEGLRPGDLCWLTTRQPRGAPPRVQRLVRVDPARSPWPVPTAPEAAE